jgi:hypothetical protein
MVANTQYCRQRYIKLVPAVSRSLKFNIFYFNAKKILMAY